MISFIIRSSAFFRVSDSCFRSFSSMVMPMLPDEQEKGHKKPLHEEKRIHRDGPRHKTDDSHRIEKRDDSDKTHRDHKRGGDFKKR